MVPRVFLQSTHDEFGPVEELRSVIEALPGTPQLMFIEAQDHFFTGALDELEKVVGGLG
jgi:hypothetical protein